MGAMSRIRSIHPGLWTDDAFMSLSAMARLLYIGLWTEAWDDGVFEWKPLTLKARIFPVDNVDVEALLREIEAAGAIKCDTWGSKLIGYIRNFRTYQRPKKPNSSGMLRVGEEAYVGLVPNQSPTGPELPPQMEDGGWKMEDENIEPPASVPDPEARALFDEVWKALPRNPTSSKPKAEAAFSATKAEDRPLILAAARARAAWFVEDCKERKRTETAGLRFEPHLSTWIEEGSWRTFAERAAAVTGPLPQMVTVNRDSEETLFKACERLRGKSSPSSMQRWSFPADIVAQARKELAH